MWIIFATLNPVSEGFRSLFIKKASRDVDPMIISWANNALPFLVFGTILFFIELKFNTMFFVGFLGSGILNVFATILYMRSISKGDISSVMPMQSFTPLFLLGLGPLILGEFPHTLGLFGILLIVIGSYMLNLGSNRRKIFAPFKMLLQNKGTRYMLVVALIFAVTANFDKISIRNSSVLQHVGFINILIFSTLTAVTFFQKKLNLENLRKGGKNILYVSMFTTGSYVFHMTALSLTLAAYVVAMKRLSIVISVILGGFLLNEPNLKERLPAAIVMFIGVILIVLS